jgi:hypothetical protein
MIGLSDCRRVLALGVCVAVLWLQGCSHLNSKQKSMKEENHHLSQWLQNIDTGELSAWTGWSPQWGIDDLLEAGQAKGEATQQILGKQSLSCHTFHLPHQSQPLQVLADHQGQVVLLRLEDARLLHSADALAQLWGPPATKNELPADHRFAPAQLWVFPQRGISLYVLDPARHGPMTLSAIALYVPTTLDIYLRDLEGDERVRMWED